MPPTPQHPSPFFALPLLRPPPSSPSPFFALPRELRDTIYDLFIPPPLTITSSTYFRHIEFTASTILPLPLQTTCKRLRAEFKEALYRHAFPLLKPLMEGKIIYPFGREQWGMEMPGTGRVCGVCPVDPWIKLSAARDLPEAVAGPLLPLRARITPCPCRASSLPSADALERYHASFRALEREVMEDCTCVFIGPTYSAATLLCACLSTTAKEMPTAKGTAKATAWLAKWLSLRHVKTRKG